MSNVEIISLLTSTGQHYSCGPQTYTLYSQPDLPQSPKPGDLWRPAVDAPIEKAFGWLGRSRGSPSWHDCHPEKTIRITIKTARFIYCASPEDGRNWTPRTTATSRSQRPVEGGSQQVKRERSPKPDSKEHKRMKGMYLSTPTRARPDLHLVNEDEEALRRKRVILHCNAPETVGTPFTLYFCGIMC
jgi:hypothetical protein